MADGIDLSARRRRNLADWLNFLPPVIRQRGQALRNDGAVAQLHWEDSHTLAAYIFGSQWYTARIEFASGSDLDVECDCPYDDDCKHLAAMALEALNYTPPPPSSGASAPASGSPKAGRAPRRGAAPATPPDEAAASFAQAVAREIGVPALGKLDLQRVEGLARLLRDGQSVVRRVDFASALALRKLEASWYETVELWPPHRPPRDLRTAWFHVAHALRTLHWVPAEALFARAPWGEIEAFLAPWLREQEVARWTAQLQAFAAAVPPLQGHSPVFRLRLLPAGGVLEWRPPGAELFSPVPPRELKRCLQALIQAPGTPRAVPLDERARRFLGLLHGRIDSAELASDSLTLQHLLTEIVRRREFSDALVTPSGQPVALPSEPLRWALSEPLPLPGANLGALADRPELGLDYELRLLLPDGTAPLPPVVLLTGEPNYYVTTTAIHPLTDLPPALPATPLLAPALRLPAAAVESAAGLAALGRLAVAPPARLAERSVEVRVPVVVACRLQRDYGSSLQVSAFAHYGMHAPTQQWNGQAWGPNEIPAELRAKLPDVPKTAPGQFARLDEKALPETELWLAQFGLKAPPYRYLGMEHSCERNLTQAFLKIFPDEFLAWMKRRPDGVQMWLDPELQSLLEPPATGTFSLTAESSGMDWFDLRLSLTVDDVTLTPAEVAALLKAPGRWVYLGKKGWRRLELQLSDEEREQLADLGLGAADLTGGEVQRLHALQLAGTRASRLLPEPQMAEVRRRAQEIRTAVAPELPAAVSADLRPYQRDGYHFLAYLSENRFGGVLADDMGLGKTLQTLAWLAWLREQGRLQYPALVVCPKSVQGNWLAEAARFCASLPVHVWTGAHAGVLPPEDRAGLLIINYNQLRLHEATLRGRSWSAVVLDEAQFIKNPISATARAACQLRAPERLALTGTPIENRLLDLWSIMAFAMPGVLGTRSAFTRNFDLPDDPLARRRLAARMRPFLLRRTKGEVARDLPARTEEDLVCELEGPQATLYQAELKRARALLLGTRTARALDAQRFHILASLLRLRQICCHPALVGSGDGGAASAKLTALFEILEPLLEEGHKVLVFSQFVEMLGLLQAQIVERGWPHLLLTGQTEDRAALVENFQQRDDPCIFLISLRAGGFGLNLTAASYVVLFDPWWNPAVESQAIDRTHRIGQKNPVIAYRLLVRDTIEEKVRLLQKQKATLATDVLGEESFAKALTLDDFEFLLA